MRLKPILTLPPHCRLFLYNTNNILQFYFFHARLLNMGEKNTPTNKPSGYNFLKESTMHNAGKPHSNLIDELIAAAKQPSEKKHDENERKP